MRTRLLGGRAPALAALVGLLFVAGSASAATIIHDNFGGSGGNAGTGGNAGAVNHYPYVEDDVGGRVPDTANLPGNAWWVAGAGTFNSASLEISGTSSSGTVTTAFNNSFGIGLGAFASTPMAISGSLNLNNLASDNNVPAVGAENGTLKGVGLGFYTTNFNGASATPTASGQNSSTWHGTVNGDSNFVGLVLTPTISGNNYLVLDQGNGNGNSPTVRAFVNLGAINSSVNHALTYSVDPVTGGVTNVNLDGTDYTSSFSGVTGLFTAANMPYAGFFGSGAFSLTNTGFVGNFDVSSVPEPTAVAVFALAGGLVLRRRRAGRRGEGEAK